MILVADSGSTKADWTLITSSGNLQHLSTRGFNPFFDSSSLIADVLTNAFAGQLDTDAIEQVFYYGAGCSDEEKCLIVTKGLMEVCPNAQVEVHHDLLAAARATCGDEAGLACIMGTGSNTCLYDGKDVVDNVTNLGFLLGDEGSGSFLGKMLIRAYYYRELPEELKIKFEKRYKITHHRQILNKIYDVESPNVYLASFSPFLSDNKDNLFIKKLVSEAFTEFIKRHIRKYPNHTILPIHFVGSIAYYFQDILQLVFDERGMKLGRIVKKPIQALTQYHFRKYQTEILSK